MFDFSRSKNFDCSSNERNETGLDDDLKESER